MALRDELDRLRRELQVAQAELKAARDTEARANELERSLSISQQECETLRAELEQRVREHEGQSRCTANLMEEPAVAEHSEAITKHTDQLAQDRPRATGELPADDDPQLRMLTVQLHESRCANQRLRSLLRVFGMVQNLDHPEMQRF
jgi:hypothetical protein